MAEEQKKTLQNATQQELLAGRDRALSSYNFKAVKQFDEALLKRFEWSPSSIPLSEGLDPTQDQNKFVDYAKSLGSGLYQGLAGVADMPANIAELGAKGVELAYQKATGETVPEKFSEGMRSIALPSPVGKLIEPKAAQAAEKYTPEAFSYQPTTDVGSSIQRVGNFLAFAGKKPITQGVAPAVVSEKVSGARGIEGTYLEVPLEIASAVLTPVIMKKIVSPSGGSITGETKKALDLLAKNGIFPTAAQSTGARQAAFVEQSTGAGLDLIEDAQRNFSRAALRRIGINSDVATTDLMDEAYSRIGANLDATIGKVSGAATKKEFDKLSDVMQTYSGQVSAGNAAPVFKEVFQAFKQSSTTGQPLTNVQIRRIRQTLNPMTRQGDTTGEAARETLNVFNSFIARNLGKEGASAWKQANKEYRDFLTLEGALGTAGQAVQGIVTPQALRAQSKQKFGLRSYVLGRSDLSELAKAGTVALKPLPSSGTAERATALGMGPTTGIGFGGLAQAFGASPEALGGAIVAGTIAPRVGAQMATTPMGQMYLRNQLIGQLDNDSLLRYLSASEIQ